MAGRRRFTKAKKPKKPRGGDPDAPSDAEWGQMTIYGGFVVQDEDDESHSFKAGDNALFFPDNRKVGTDLELHEYWVARIREIRARSDGDVWVLVQWYFSGEDVATVIKSFDAKACGKLELIFSDHLDYVSSLAFNGIATVKKYDESNFLPDDIYDEEFYYRYTLEYTARRINPKPGTNTCICKRPYNPDDIANLMHICPRPSCGRAYHQSCLIEAKSKESRSSIAGRELRLLCVSPDSDSVFSLTDLITSEPPKKRPRGRPKKVDPQLIPPVKSPGDILGSLPLDLVLVAQQPIVKGAMFEDGGVVGNVRPVTEARRMVYNAVEGLRIPENWEEVIDVEGALVRGLGKKVLPALVCPNCASPI